MVHIVNTVPSQQAGHAVHPTKNPLLAIKYKPFFTEIKKTLNCVI